jgi:hypothetical protein
MGPHNWVKTIVRCSRHNRELPPLCVRVEREVPEPLRCSPGGGSATASGAARPDCPCGGRLDDLSRRVTDAMRGGLGQWVRRGSVVVEY